ncbi:MAG: SIMPL domain-containing protein [Bacteroidaceae bacterium]|nr:SIMPL domain-containing protein [Bacteroidaceae bacterium]
MSTNRNTIIAAIIIASGLFLMGLCIQNGLENGLKDERIVSVRGLSERIVPADKVVWPLVYKEVGNDLKTLSQQVNNKNKIIVDYLISKGIAKDEISIASPEIIDLQAERYMNQNVIYRYNLTSIITVSSQQVELVRNLIAEQGELLDKGVAIVSGEYNTQVNYLFTGLNDLKPDMIAEATRNAREAAQQFATDSDSKLGKIKTASQGQFSISDRDQYTPYLKTVRVVTSVVYYLKD